MGHAGLPPLSPANPALARGCCEQGAELKMTSINLGDGMQRRGRKPSTAGVEESPGMSCFIVAFFFLIADVLKIILQHSY